MKPTRKDLIRVLKERELARIKAKIEELGKQKKPLPNYQAACEATALELVKRQPEVKKLVRTLDAAKIRYEFKTFANSVGWNKPVRVQVQLKIAGVDRDVIEVMPSLDALAEYQSADVANGKLEQQLNMLRRRQHVLLCGAGDDNSVDIIEETLSTLLMEGDESLQQLLKAVETRLDAALSAATLKQ